MGWPVFARSRGYGRRWRKQGLRHRWVHSGLTYWCEWLLCTEHCVCVVGGEHCHGSARLDSGRAEVRHERNVVEFEQPGVDAGFFLVDVEPGTGE